MIRDNLVGLTFSKLKVLKPKLDKRGHFVKWECRCICGKKIIVHRHSLTRKIRPQKSCGCDQSYRYKKHGDYQKAEYYIWEAMIQRCYNPKNPGFHNYGGRGIQTSKSWRSYCNFIKDIGRRPTTKHSLERKNNDKGYCKCNCKWGTKPEQVRNTRRNIFLTAFGKTLCITDWSRKQNISARTIKRALARGKTQEQALTPRIKTGKAVV